MTEHLIVGAYGVDDDAVKHGIKWLLEYAKNNGHSEAALFIETVSQIDNLRRALGDRITDALIKNRSITSDGVAIVVLTGRGGRVSFTKGPVLAVWTTDDRMATIDDMGSPAVCVVQWGDHDLDAWKAAWSPVDVRTGSASPAVTITNPVVEAAMVSLTNRVNLSTGILHPSDKPAAINMFRLLRQSGEQFEPSEIRAWARQHGWRSRHADDLAELAQKIKDGKTVRGGDHGGWADNIVELWRQDAAKVVK